MAENDYVYVITARSGYVIGEDILTYQSFSSFNSSRHENEISFIISQLSSQSSFSIQSPPSSSPSFLSSPVLLNNTPEWLIVCMPGQRLTITLYNLRSSPFGDNYGGDKENKNKRRSVDNYYKTNSLMAKYNNYGSLNKQNPNSYSHHPSWVNNHKSNKNRYIDAFVYDGNDQKNRLENIDIYKKFHHKENYSHGSTKKILPYNLDDVNENITSDKKTIVTYNKIKWGNSKKYNKKYFYQNNFKKFDNINNNIKTSSGQKFSHFESFAIFHSHSTSYNHKTNEKKKKMGKRMKNFKGRLMSHKNKKKLQKYKNSLKVKFKDNTRKKRKINSKNNSLCSFALINEFEMETEWPKNESPEDEDIEKYEKKENILEKFESKIDIKLNSKREKYLNRNRKPQNDFVKLSRISTVGSKLKCLSKKRLLLEYTSHGKSLSMSIFNPPTVHSFNHFLSRPHAPHSTPQSYGKQEFVLKFEGRM